MRLPVPPEAQRPDMDIPASPQKLSGDPPILAVSPPQAARMLGVSKPKLYEVIRQPGFPAFRLGSRVLISVDGLRKWVEARAAAGMY